jgi:hypothetical protein
VRTGRGRAEAEEDGERQGTYGGAATLSRTATVNGSCNSAAPSEQVRRAACTRALAVAEAIAHGSTREELLLAVAGTWIARMVRCVRGVGLSHAIGAGTVTSKDSHRTRRVPLGQRLHQGNSDTGRAHERMMTADVGEARLPAAEPLAKPRSMHIVPESALARCKAAFEFVVAACGEKDQLTRPHMSQLFLELGLLKVAPPLSRRYPPTLKTPSFWRLRCLGCNAGVRGWEWMGFGRGPSRQRLRSPRLPQAFRDHSVSPRHPLERASGYARAQEAENAAALDHIFHEMDTERRGTVGFRELLIFLSYNGELARRIELAQTLSPWMAQRPDTRTGGGSPSPTHSLSHSPPSTPETGSLAELNPSLKRNTSATPEDDPLSVKMEVRALLCAALSPPVTHLVTRHASHTCVRLCGPAWTRAGGGWGEGACVWKRKPRFEPSPRRTDPRDSGCITHEHILWGAWLGTGGHSDVTAQLVALS